MLIASCTPTQHSDGDGDKKQNGGDDDDKKIAKIEKQPSEWVGKKYNVAKIEEEGKVVKFSEKQPTLSFEEGKASIKLSVNGCFASYVATEYTIKINEEGCTEACCDSEDDKFLLKLIRGNTFNFGEFGNYTVLMNGDNKIWLTAGK